MTTTLEEVLGPGGFVRVAAMPDGTLETDRDPFALRPATPDQEQRLRAAFGIADPAPEPSIEELRAALAAARPRAELG